MDIHIALGWYILPLLFTIGSWLWLRFGSDPSGYAGAIAGAFFILVWLIANLFVWLVYAACAAIFNIF